MTTAAVLLFALIAPATRPGLPLDDLLVEAARDGRAEHVRALLDAGADAGAETEHGVNALETALFEAQRRGREGGLKLAGRDDGVDFRETVRALLDAGADAAAVGGWNLAETVAAGDVEVVRMLLDAGADPTAGDRGRTLLTAAAGRGHEEVVELLLSRGAGVDAPDAPDEAGRIVSPLAAAAGAEHDAGACVRLLLEAGADPTPDSPLERVRIAEAAAGADPAVRRRLIEAGIDLSSRPVGEPALRMLVIGAEPEDAEPRPTTPPGNAAMERAVTFADVAAVQDLLDAGVDDPAVLAAAFAGALELWLDPDDAAILDVEDAQNSLEERLADDRELARLRVELRAVARLLLARGMLAGWPDGGATLALRAAMLGDDDLLDLLLAHGGGAKAGAFDLDAVAQAQEDAAGNVLFLTGDFDPRLAGRLDRAGIPVALPLAAAAGEVDLVGRALRDSPLIEVIDEVPREEARRILADWSLRLAAARGHAEVCRVLLAAGADPDAGVEEWAEREMSLPPALYYAAWGGNPEVVELLLSAGATPNPADETGETLLEKVGPRRPAVAGLIRQAAATRPAEEAGP